MQTVSQYLPMALPLIAFATLWAFFTVRSEKMPPQAAGRWRLSFLHAAIAWAILAFVFTEILSLRSEVRLLPLACCWSAVTVISLFLCGIRLKGYKRFNTVRHFQVPDGSTALFLWMTVALGLTALMAFVSPPNNYDSMTYHMSRVAHWWANGTVAFYPTNIERQLWNSPLAEYIILQFFVLGHGSDRLSNLVQWFCLCGCAVSTSLIALQLGANRFTQVLTAFIVLTTPIILLEGSSTQNDLACAFFTTVTLYYLLSGRTALTGISLGLAILTKSTAGLFAFPFLLAVLFYDSNKSRNWIATTGKFLLIGSLALAVNLTHWSRNWMTFGNPLGDTAQVRQVESRTHAPGPLASNLMRNLAIELVTPLPKVSQMEEGAIRHMHAILRIDPDDSRNTFEQMRFTVPAMVPFEDTAANPLQTLLLLAATVYILSFRDLRRSKTAVFVLCIWGGFLLFSWQLSWQPWGGRLLTPFFVLASFPIAVLLNEIRRSSRMSALPAIGILMVTSLLPLLHNSSRPVVSVGRTVGIFSRPKEEQYFMRNQQLFSCYEDAINALSRSSHQNVGLELTEDNFEYPLWALARLHDTEIRFLHVAVDNPTKNAPISEGTVPKTTIAIHDPGFQPDTEIKKPVYVSIRSVDSTGAQTVERLDCKSW